MLTDLIKRILENERKHVSSREEAVEPHVIVEKDSEKIRALYQQGYDIAQNQMSEIKKYLEI